MAETFKKRIYCAIYTRKSTSEGLDQDFTSLDAQRESCENYIRSQKNEGWVLLPDKYDDGGFTGANIERPSLQKLVSDIKDGRINCVVVYKVDRLSRSLLDFVQLLQLFDMYSFYRPGGSYRHENGGFHHSVVRMEFAGSCLCI